MKNDRHNHLLQIIAEESIETQEQLLERLRERGIKSTQATISRDIKELHLVKEPAGQGRYRYAVSAHRTKLNFADRLRTILRESLLSSDYAQNIVVIKTMPGLAQGAASALDGMQIANMVGSLAGDDTVMIIMRDQDSASDFCNEIRDMLR
ncbi:MAG: arginine repressor [Ruminococcaceae bacterium]|nr:arginine repressor [Oscillospiraceae bacterium]